MGSNQLTAQANPKISQRTSTQPSTPNPNNTNTKPMMLATSRGSVLKPVIMFMACRNSFPNV